MYTFKVKLKQHTPLIHFQWDQKGATLRASEVKPKLDRFILTRLGREKDSANYKEAKKLYDTKKISGAFEKLEDHERGYWIAKSLGWLVGAGEKPALDYRMKIVASQKNTSYDDFIDVREKPDEKLENKNLAGFFGNTMSFEEFKNGTKDIKRISFCDKINLFIVSWDAELKEKITADIGEFFFYNNFGCRQNRGFGSFSVEGFHIGEPGCLYFDLNYREGQFKKLFEGIDWFCRSLKGGLNIKAGTADKMYFKSLMFEYAKQLKPSEQWDKRTIRHRLFLNNEKYIKILEKRQGHEGTLNYEVKLPEGRREYYDFRDLLGLSTKQRWSCYGCDVTKKVSYKDEKKESEIERFNSPLLFKPLYTEEGWRVYIIERKIPDVFLGAKVEVSNGEESVHLIVYPDFDLHEFLKIAIRKFKIKDVEYGEGFDTSEEAKVLDKIYGFLKKKIQAYDRELDNIYTEI